MNALAGAGKSSMRSLAMPRRRRWFSTARVTRPRSELKASAEWCANYSTATSPGWLSNRARAATIWIGKCSSVNCAGSLPDSVTTTCPHIATRCCGLRTPSPGARRPVECGLNGFTRLSRTQSVSSLEKLKNAKPGRSPSGEEPGSLPEAQRPRLLQLYTTSLPPRKQTFGHVGRAAKRAVSGPCSVRALSIGGPSSVESPASPPMRVTSHVPNNTPASAGAFTSDFVDFYGRNGRAI